MKIVVLTGSNIQCNKIAFPAFFSKADSTLLKGGKPFFIPDFASQCVASVHLVGRVSRLGKGFSERFASRYMDAWTLGVCFTAQEMGDGVTPSMTSDFDGTTMIGEFLKTEQVTWERMECRFEIGNIQISGISLQGMESYLYKSLAELSKYFTWRQGDLIFSKPLAECVVVKENDHVTGQIGEERLLEFNVK